jgi:hypothetical protein
MLIANYKDLQAFTSDKAHRHAARMQVKQVKQIAVEFAWPSVVDSWKRQVNA